jgi:SAM-dependent methyltransferase
MSADNETYKPVLDVCCGTKAFWFDKADSRAVFHDKRYEDCPIKPDAGHPARNLIVRPDVVGDFTDLQFKSDTFALVVFDPPHASFGNSSVMAKTYGTLGGVDWRDMLRRGFAECFRVLRPEGTLIFKWCEWEIPVREVLALTTEKPLFGHISGRRAQTHWIAFLKPNAPIERSARSADALRRVVCNPET